MTLRNWIFGIAVLAALAPTRALAIPAHYVVFTMDEKGHVRPDFYQQVELARAPEPLSADLGFGEGTHTDERIVYRAFRQQVGTLESAAPHCRYCAASSRTIPRAATRASMRM